jgi:hypothetical protein
MNPKYKFTGKHQYQQLTSVTHPDGPRVYETPTGPATSVTTILSLLPAPALDAWIARVGIEEAERIRDEAAVIGTCMHNRLEAYVRGVPYVPVESEHERIAEILFMTVRSSVLLPLTEVWGVEEALYLHALYAGRTDVMGIYAGKRSIIDYKTGLRQKSEDVLEKYKLQIAAYAVAHDWMFEQMPGYEPIEQGVILVGIRPNQYKGARVQKVIVPEDELNLYRSKWLDVVEQYHAGVLGQPGLNTLLGETDR